MAESCPEFAPNKHLKSPVGAAVTQDNGTSRVSSAFKSSMKDEDLKPVSDNQSEVQQSNKIKATLQQLEPVT